MLVHVLLKILLILIMLSTEIRIGYSIPAKYTGPFRNVKLSAYGRNLAIWGRDNEHFDPEYVHGSGNVQGIEGGALPSLRTYGFNLTFDF